MKTKEIIELILMTKNKSKDENYQKKRLESYLNKKDLTNSDVILRKQIIGDVLRRNRKRLDNFGLLRLSEFVEFNGSHLTQGQIIAIERGRGYTINSLLAYISALNELAKIYNIKLKEINVGVM